MDIKSILLVAGTALFTLTATASAGPMSVSSSKLITPPIQIEQARYYHRHHYRHYGWRPGWHGYGYPYGYGTGLAALGTAPLMTGRSAAVSGNYCATPVKTCLLYEPGWLGTGCSCKVYGGHARGLVE